MARCCAGRLGAALEAGACSLLGALLLWVAPRWRPASALWCGRWSSRAGGRCAVSHRSAGCSTATPGAGLLLLFIVLLVMTLTEVTRGAALEHTCRRSANRPPASQASSTPRSGSRRGMLPRADLLRGERASTCTRVLTPAREVGGDLYDYFLLDARRLFFLSATSPARGCRRRLFMAVARRFTRASCCARRRRFGALMSAANAEVSRDNAEQLFVTAFVGILDLDAASSTTATPATTTRSCCAGPGRRARLEDGDGPPLCALDDSTTAAPPAARARRRAVPGHRRRHRSAGRTRRAVRQRAPAALLAELAPRRRERAGWSSAAAPTSQPSSTAPSRPTT